MLISLLTVLALLKNTLSRRGNCNCDEIHTTNATSATTAKASAQQQKQQQQQPTSVTTVTTTAATKSSALENGKFKLIESSSSLLSKMSNFPGQSQQQSFSGGSVTSASGDDNVDGVSINPSVIVFNNGDKQCCHEININDKHVKVIGSSGSHDHGSSKVKLENVVDYKWETRNYPGHLVSVHVDGIHIAYVINVHNKMARVEGMIRITKKNTGEKNVRALIKGMTGEVLDLQFAHIEKELILASIDLNTLFVHKIDSMEETLLCNLLIKIEDPLANYTPKYDKISWCPYIDVPGEDDEDSHLIVWARGSMYQCFNINEVVEEHGHIGKTHPDAITTGYLKFYDELLIITWVALSPDGSTLGVGSADGVIRFYQVYMHDKEPRCLHQWKPHGGKPISSFFFLDNLTKNVADTYWKYAITGAANNSEFKVWDCGTWECLQTLTLTTPLADEKKPERFICEIDRTSSYLVVSSLWTRTCYVLQIVNNNHNNSAHVKDTESGDSTAKDTSSSSSIVNTATKLKRSLTPLVYIKSISEFPLNSGILSFSIVDAAVRRYKCASDNYLCDELDDYDEETNSIYCVVLRMLIVQSKSLQKCRVLYQPTVTEGTDVKSTISDNSLANVSKDSAYSNAVAASTTFNSSTNKNSSNIDNGENDAVAVDEDDDIEEDKNDNDDELEKSEKSEQTTNALEAFLGIGSSGSAHQQTTSSVSSIASVVGVAAAAAAAPSAANAELINSRTNSPQNVNSSANSSGKSYGQVNLMTPDAFSATTNEKSPDCVSSDVLNTILMLASVAGQQATPSSKPENLNILDFVNNKIIEGQEHQKMQLKQSMESQKKFMSIDNNSGRVLSDALTSGGSSPSREVQEILSLRDYDLSSFSDGVIDVPSANTIKEASSTAVTVSEIDSSVVSKANQSVVVAAAPAASSSLTATSWPKLPEGPKATTKHSAELQNAANLISQAVSASSTGNLNNNYIAPTLVGSNANTCSNSGSNAELSEINSKMSQLIDLVKVQSMQINSLQNEIADMKKNNPIISAKNMSEFSFKLEMQLSKLMEQYLKRYENEHKKKLISFMAGREVQNRELCDSFIQIVNQYVLTQFGDVVSKVMTIEIQRQVAPLMTAKIEHLQQQIQIDMTQKFSAFDLMLKETISQACKSKNIIDTFGKSVLVGVQGSLQAAFIESMSSTLIPAYEKSSQNMFQQLHDAFSIGIKEFMEQFDNYLQQMQPMQDSTEEILNKFSGFRQHLDSILVKHRNTVTETMLETRKDVKGLEILLARQIQESIRVEVRKCFENQAVALRSQANTPAPIYDMKDTIKHLLHQGQINKAFHQALLANDLNLVEFTLKSADHNAVFTPDCCLEQKVLLSLIQQISADMSNHNEVKQNYLAEALLAINSLDPITREHAPKVLQELFRNCQMFLLNYPKSPQCSNVRMLMKAVQAYKDQF